MISTDWSRSRFDCMNLSAIVVVMFARTCAFTPEPRPSESAARERFSLSIVSSWTSSPQAACPVFVNWVASISMKRSSIN